MNGSLPPSSGLPGDSVTGKTSHNTKGAASEVIDTLRLVSLALIVALVLRMFVFQPFNIPSGSMQPTLLVGDFLYVSKTSYGYSRASLIWPFSHLPVNGRLFAHTPERGDVLVFKNKKDNNRDYIKRLIGLPGDEITIREGVVFINGVPVQRDLLQSSSAICENQRYDGVPTFRETLPNGVSYVVQECAGRDGFLDNRGPYTVPTGHYFMMGDNRDESRDSRVTTEVGTVPFDDIVGRAERVIMSVDGHAAKFWQVWRWPAAIRSARMMKAIQ